MERIYWMDSELLQESVLYGRALAACSPERREALEGLRNEVDRLESLAAACLLDLALRPFRLREREMDYGRGAAGKPFFRNRPELHFSLSHGDGLAVCAIADRPVGVDVEGQRPVSEALLRRYFTPEERAAAEPLRLWTLKESCCKMTGRGLAALTEIHLKFGASVTACGLDAAFWESRLPGGHFLALCREGVEPLFPEVCEISRSDLG